MVIKDYSGKKLVEYLKDGMKVQIVFIHGLGDTLMFYPIYEILISTYPNIKFDLFVTNGQEMILGKNEFDSECKNHDYVFVLSYPMSEGTDYMKSEYCCMKEIGLDYKTISECDKNFVLKSNGSPFIGVHFQGTSLPHSVNCEEKDALTIWNAIKNMGMIPIECHFQHMYHNPYNAKYAFVDNTLRQCKPNIQILMDVIASCRGFIGVASGPFVAAMHIIPKRTLYLQKHHKIQTYFKNYQCSILDIIKEINKDEVESWLTMLL